MTERLRPLGIGDMLDQTVRVYRRGVLTFLGVVAVALVPFMALEFAILTLGVGGLDTLGAVLSGDEALTLSLAFGLLALLLAGALYLAILSTVVPAALARATSATVLGPPLGVWASYRLGWRALWGLMWASALVGAFFLALVLLLLTCIGLPVALPAMAFFGTRWALVVPVCALERPRPLAALERSWRLLNTKFWHGFIFLTLLYLFAMIAMLAPAGGLSLAMALIPSLPPALSTAVQILLTALEVMVGLPILMVGITVLYFDLRVRREGLDLDLALAEMERGSVAANGGLARRAGA